AAKDALDAGHTKYAPAGGLPRLRELVSEKLLKDNQLAYEPSQIMISTGGKQALFNVLVSILGPGDEALIPVPYWVSYPEIVKLARATPVFIPASEDNGYKMTPDQLRKAITPKTRALILNSPSNPTGTVYQRDELEEIAQILIEKQIAVVSDEIYEKLTYDGNHHTSIGSLSEEIKSLTITCNGFSKAYAATGWRLGYAAGPQHVIKAAIDIQSHSTSGANTFAQYGAIAALEGSDEVVEEMRSRFQVRRDLMLEGLLSIPRIACSKPDGAFYLFPRINETGLDSVTFCQRLLAEYKVATVPGLAFGADSNIRLSYATDRDTIEKGLDRLSKFVTT
ncbi:MAG: pyridoxal phosphate-dependent aminotransferase, partial [Chloroflexota bacterium]